MGGLDPPIQGDRCGTSDSGWRSYAVATRQGRPWRDFSISTRQRDIRLTPRAAIEAISV